MTYGKKIVREKEKMQNEKINLVERIQALLFKCDVRFLRRALRDLKDYIKDKK